MAQTTLEKIDDYVADARTLLQDTIAPYRYGDDTLVTAMNVTLLEARRLRPDLFVYNGPLVQSLQGVDGTIIKLEAQFRLGLLHGLVAHILERDQEDIQDERASTFMGIFNAILIGKSGIPAAKAS